MIRKENEKTVPRHKQVFLSIFSLVVLGTQSSERPVLHPVLNTERLSAGETPTHPLHTDLPAAGVTGSPMGQEPGSFNHFS